MDLFVYSDESGVFDSAHNKYFVFAGLILLGKENVSNVSWQDLGDKFRTAQLFGKLANIFADLPTKKPLPGYKVMNPMVYCGLYPVDSDDYLSLKDALEKYEI